VEVRSPRESAAWPASTTASAGVNYDILDTFQAVLSGGGQRHGRAAVGHGLTEAAGIRGESAYLIESPRGTTPRSRRGSGPRCWSPTPCISLTGRSFYRSVAIDDVATIATPVCRSARLPVSIAMYAAVGQNEYLADRAPGPDLADGFAAGLPAGGAVWSGGETQTLTGMVTPGTVILEGRRSAWCGRRRTASGAMCPRATRSCCWRVRACRTNGLTLCRAVADRLPQGYLTPLADGRTYAKPAGSVGDLRPVRGRLSAGGRGPALRRHMTGHGWRKLMRLETPFVYTINSVPTRNRCSIWSADAGSGQSRGVRHVQHGRGSRVVAPTTSASALDLGTGDRGTRAWHGGSVRRDGARKSRRDPAAGR